MPGPRTIVDSLLDTLRALEDGRVSLSPVGEHPQNVYAGNCCYRASNGWQFIVFNDCGEWDYLDQAINPAGEVETVFGVPFEESEAAQQELNRWEAAQKNLNPLQLWQRWGIPGYLQLRCEFCGHRVRRQDSKGVASCAAQGRRRCKWYGRGKKPGPVVIDRVYPEPKTQKPDWLVEVLAEEAKFRTTIWRRVLRRWRKFPEQSVRYREFLLLPDHSRHFTFFLEHGMLPKGICSLPRRVLRRVKKKWTGRKLQKFRRRYKVR